MSAMIFEVEGISVIVKILNAIMQDEDKDSPIMLRSQEMLDTCNEILENYMGIKNDFSCPRIKDIYYDFLLNVMDEIIGKKLFVNLADKKIKSVQLCVDNDDLILLHQGSTT